MATLHPPAKATASSEFIVLKLARIFNPVILQSQVGNYSASPRVAFVDLPGREVSHPLQYLRCLHSFVVVITVIISVIINISNIYVFLGGRVANGIL